MNTGKTQHERVTALLTDENENSKHRISRPLVLLRTCSLASQGSQSVSPEDKSFKPGGLYADVHFLHVLLFSKCTLLDLRTPVF